ncbi:MAG TPA: HD-GYP domain-containing protein, partial [Campylobacterales bacterium]|nr:HD-GYP domain-containing protein [Campylobacterales bacterium]
KKLKDEKIPLIAQIVAIADIFDALTTKRSYKDALTSYTALRLMKSRDFTGLNETILNALVRSFYH